MTLHELLDDLVKIQQLARTSGDMLLRGAIATAISNLHGIMEAERRKTAKPLVEPAKAKPQQKSEE
jgi:hypothetical protein